MIYQLSWKILPGLRGMSCSEFSATATHFALQRFSNNATAFETVKTYVIERAARKAQS
jgi:hypothetical protein